MNNITELIHLCPQCDLPLTFAELEAKQCIVCDERFDPVEFAHVPAKCYHCNKIIKAVSIPHRGHKVIILCDDCYLEIN